MWKLRKSSQIVYRKVNAKNPVKPQKDQNLGTGDP